MAAEFTVRVELTFRCYTEDVRDAEYELIARLRNDAKEHAVFASDSEGNEIQLTHVETLE